MSVFKFRYGMRGFTLIELMIVVAILSVLAGVAIPSYIGYAKRSRVSEAMASIASIKAGEEEYAGTTTTGCYLAAAAYPTTAPGVAPQTWTLPATVAAWGATGLNLTPNRTVWYQYQVYASGGGECGAANPVGGAGTLAANGVGTGVLNEVSNPCGITDAIVRGWVTSGAAYLTNWYIVVARSDMDGDANLGQVVGFIDETNMIQCEETE